MPNPIETNKAAYFVTAAIVASELHKAMLVAKQISVTACNARALALRAGVGASGFRAITDFIDELATVTIRASIDINGQAITLSQLACDSIRSDSAISRFKHVYATASDATHIHSLDAALARAEQKKHSLVQKFNKESEALREQLSDLTKELRTATVLAAMSRVEASQAGHDFEVSLNAIADSVAHAAETIQSHVRLSQQLYQDVS